MGGREGCRERGKGSKTMHFGPFTEPKEASVSTGGKGEKKEVSGEEGG